MIIHFKSGKRQANKHWNITLLSKGKIKKSTQFDSCFTIAEVSEHVEVYYSELFDFAVIRAK